MAIMHPVYGRDLDLNLLRVFVVVAEAGSVTEAASRLYLTQPAVSAALRRLTSAVGAPLFVRSGRGLALTGRGERLFSQARPHLEALVSAALHADTFDPKTTERVVRIGLSDKNEEWLLPPLIRTLAREAPRMRLIVVPVQFRTIGQILATGNVDLAVTVADELPADIVREPLFSGGFVCLYDGRHVTLPRKVSLERYLAAEHGIVSYNGDLRGIVEDLLQLERRVLVSVPSFTSLGAVIGGTSLLATVPEMVAKQLMAKQPYLRTSELPFSLSGTPMELLYRRASADDDALGFIREHIVRIAQRAWGGRPRKRPQTTKRQRRP